MVKLFDRRDVENFITIEIKYYIIILGDIFARMSLNRMVDQLKLSDTVGSEDVVIEEEERQEKGVEVRKLSDEEMKKLSDDKYCVSEFKRNRLEIEAKKNWDLFYRRNKANFFKDRYWTFREFDELNEDAESQVNTILEIGCGVGNFIYPLIKHNKRVFAYACDFAPNAIDLLKQNADYDTSRINAFVCDVTQPNSLADSLPSGVQVDLVTLIFVLSAIHPDKMKQAVENIAKVGSSNLFLILNFVMALFKDRKTGWYGIGERLRHLRSLDDTIPAGTQNRRPVLLQTRRNSYLFLLIGQYKRIVLLVE